jgi:hypothetical protein
MEPVEATYRVGKNQYVHDDCFVYFPYDFLDQKYFKRLVVPKDNEEAASSSRRD